MQLHPYEIEHNAYLRQNGAECTVLLRKSGAFPLPAPCEIALYGNGARKTIKGGTGSGEVNSRFFVTVEQGLKDAGFTITTEKWLSAYDRLHKKANSAYVKRMKAEAKAANVPAFSYCFGKTMPLPEYDLPINGKGDTAVYVLARVSGEGCDREMVPGDVYLSDSEKRDILACARQFRRFILVLNVGGPVDLSPLEEVKDILVLSQLGIETGHILADILLGRQNPSGKLATTWTTGALQQDVLEFGTKDTVHYGEGIYVGYRYFDSTGIAPEYPFGFGLSYTEFAVESVKTSLQGSVVNVAAQVRNVGSFPGKEVLQLYCSSPEGRLDKPYQALAAYAKTACLQPGEAGEVALSFSMEEIASYDEQAQAYVLEPGLYVMRLGNASQNTRPVVAISLEQEVTTRRVRAAFGDPGFVDWKPSRPMMGGFLPPDLEVLNLDPAVVACVSVDYGQEEPVIEPEILALSEEELCHMVIGAFAENEKTSSIIGNAGLTVAGAAGQTTLTLRDKGIGSLVLADGPAGVRISKTYKRDAGGVYPTGVPLPASMTQFMNPLVVWLAWLTAPRPKGRYELCEQYCTAVPIGTAIAQSFNTEFAHACGDIVGDEMHRFGVHLWLAPALNIHRSIRCGRNFEYYSEDPFISGTMAAAVTNGVQAHGDCGVTIKHFCANNQEYNRTHCDSRVSERAMREIYLRGFELCVRLSAPKAVMTSYNLLNGTHTAEHRALTEDVLRREFGFRGIVMTDWVIPGYKSVPDPVHPSTQVENVVMAGGDLFMPGCEGDYRQLLAKLQQGKVTRHQLEVNCSRILRMIRELHAL